MCTSGPSYLFNSALIQESPITDKYYLQLGDHTLLDLFKQAIKSILIFNVPLEELPIIHLQKEIYLIYDNRIIKEQDIIDAVEEEIRKTAKQQKKFLDMSFTYLEKEKSNLSDMRESDDLWSVSWKKYKSSEVDDSFKKSYGVVANLVCNNYNTLVQSIREILKLLEHLHKECLIPRINTAEMETSLLQIVTHQFFLQYNCLDLHQVFPILAQPQKRSFVYCSDYGIELRKKITKYTEDSLFDLLMSSNKPKKTSQIERMNNNENEDRDGLKRLMKEMIFKEFRTNEIISPLFDENGHLRFLDPTLQTYDDQLQPIESLEKVELDQPTSNSPPNLLEKVSPDVEAPLAEANSQQLPQKIEIILEIVPRVQLQPPIKKQIQQIQTPKKEQVELSKPNPQKLPILEKAKSSNQIPIKIEKKQSADRLLATKPEKEKSKSEIKIVEPQKQEARSDKVKEQNCEKIHVSTTKIVLSSGTTIEARMTSLTITEQNPDKLFESINTMRKGKTSAEIIQQLAKDYANAQSKNETKQQRLKAESEDKMQNDTEIDKQQAQKKKKKKNKKKKNNKKSLEKEEMPRTKSESLSVETQKHEVSPSKNENRVETLTQEEKMVSNYLETLQIDQNNRIQCKIDEEKLKSWRKKLEALKKSFLK